LKYLTGTSTFYFLVNIEKYKGSSTEFALKMLNKHRIAVVPGSAYGKSTKSFIRLGIGTESLERIEQAIVLISKEILQN
jgi:aspartate aminotransferase/aminotransferase